MKRLVVLLGVLSAGFAGLADAFSDALDCSGLTFTTSSTTGTADWTVQANEVYRGATALRSGKISNDASTWLETTVEGPGELSFWWKASSESVYFDFLDISVDGDTQGQIGGMGLGWEEKRVLVKGKGPHTIRWTYQKDGSASSGEDCGWLDALSWTPAPEALVVSFNTDGGSAMPARIFEVGDVYGVLGVPVREGHTFLGWHEGDVLGAHVMEDRLVPFQAATTLYARWGRPVATAMRDAKLKFATSAANAFQLVNVRTPLGREAAGVEFSELTSDGESCQPWEACKSTLSTTVKGPCYVSFAWRGNFEQVGETPEFQGYPCSSWLKWRLEVDGKEEAGAYYEMDNGEWKKEYLYLPKGTHRLRWTVKSRPGFYEVSRDGVYDCVVTKVPSFFVGDIVREPYGPQATPDAWASKLVNYGSWVTGDAAKFEKVYARRIAKNGADYEARVFHALALLAGLAEHAQFKDFAKKFGYSVDYLHCTLTGSPKLTAKSPAVNTMVDKALAVGVPVLKKALADLTAIPDDWTGTVKLSAATWPLDEDVYLDRADVQYARASLQATLASLYFLGGYDLTVDWAKVKGEANWRAKVPAFASLPAVGDEEAWSRVAPISTDLKVEAEVRVVRVGNKLAFRMVVPDEVADSMSVMDVVLSDGTVNMDVDLELGGDADAYGTADLHVWDARGDYEDGKSYQGLVSRAVMEKVWYAVVDCSAVPNFARRSWSATEGAFYGPNREWDWEVDDFQARMQRTLLAQPKFLQKVRNAARLTTAKGWTARALNMALQADAAVLARTDDALHFIEYEPELEQKLDIARTNTRLALEALSAPVTFDLPNVVTNFTSCTNVAFSLLPGGGVMDIYLGALFEGRITRALAPKTGLTGTRDLVADWDHLPDPTFAGLFPQMGMDHVADLAAYYDVQTPPSSAVPPLLVPGEKIVLDCPQYIGFRVKNLPKGWTWDAAQGRLTGTASTAFTLTFTGGGVSKRMPFKLAAKPRLIVGRDGDNAVAVTGGGTYAANAKVKAVAAVTSGYAFGGWWDENDNLVSVKASYAFTMPRTDVRLTARAVPLDSDGFCVRAVQDEVPLTSSSSICQWPYHPVNDSVGAYFEVESESPFTLSASGLPPGVKLVKYDAASYALLGRPTKKGVYRARFSGRNNGGFASSCVVKFVVDEAEEQLLNQARVDFDGFGYVVDVNEEGDDEEDEDPGNAGRYPFTGEAFSQTLAMETVNAFGRVKSVKVTGLPPGYAARYASGNLTVSGVATVAGAYKVTVAATCTNGRVAKSQTWLTIQDAGSIYLPLAVKADSAKRGTLSGGGVKRIGSTVKLAATAKKDKAKYVFGGWYEDADCMVPATDLLASGEWRKAPLSFQLMWDFPYLGLYGRFVSAAEDAISFDQAVYELNLIDAEETACAVSVLSASLPTVTARGVPAGMKFNGRKLFVTDLSKVPPGWHTVTLKAVNLSGKTATAKVYVTVPNLTDAVDAGLLSGLVTSEMGYAFSTGMKTSFDLQEDLGIEVAPGWTLAVTGLPTGWTYKNGKISGVASVSGPITVTFTVTRGKLARKATATFRMDALPASLVGSYNGLLSYEWNERHDGDSGDPLNITNVVDCGASSSSDWADKPAPTPVKVSVSKGGKVSARVGTLSFSATGFSSEEDGVYRVTLVKQEKITSGSDKGCSLKRTLTLAIDTHVDWDGRQLKGYYYVGNLCSPGLSCGAVVAQRNPYGRTADGSYENTEAGEVVRTFLDATGDISALDVRKLSSTQYALICRACYIPSNGKYPTPTPALRARVSASGVVTLKGKIAGKKVSGTAVLEVGPGDSDPCYAHFVLKPDSKTTLYIALVFPLGCAPEGVATIVK